MALQFNLTDGNASTLAGAWNRSLRTSGSFSYMIQTLWMSPWCSLIRLMNRFSSAIAKGCLSLMNTSKVKKENYRQSI